MFGSSYKNTWECTHACTAFFHIDPKFVQNKVPPELKLKVDKEGRAEIELGYVRFRANANGLGLPAVEEMAWAIAVERTKGFGFAFYAMNLAADNDDFLTHNANIGFNVHKTPTKFVTDLDKRTFHVEDAAGPICTLRHQPEGSLSLPFFPVSTEVWTGSAGNLKRRQFKWRGMAKVHLAAAVATTIYDHPFFGGAKAFRASPVPANVFSSQRVAKKSAQLFTDGIATTP